MKKVMVYFVIVALLIGPLGGCAGLSTEEKAALFGALGAGVGAVIDDDKPLRGAAIGLAVGLLAGILIGKYEETKLDDGATADNHPDWKPDQGVAVKVEDVCVEPERIEAGQPVKLIIRYTLLNPNDEEQIEVREKREILSGEKSLKEIGPQVTNRNTGTYLTKQTVEFPTGLPEGGYTLKGVVEASGTEDSMEKSFMLVHISEDPGNRLAFIPLDR